MRTIVWFRGKDLRLTDHEPLNYALSRGEVIPLFVLDPHFFRPDRAQELPHRIQFLLESLAALQDEIRAKGSRLVLATGRSVEVVPHLAELWQADEVVAQRWVEPFGRLRDDRIASRLAGRFRIFDGETLASPEKVRTQSGGVFSVYTPFSRAFRRDVTIGKPLAAPSRLPPLPALLPCGAFSVSFDGSNNLPTPADVGLNENPRIEPGGERAGFGRLKSFISEQLEHYDVRRDRMDLDGTSRLSAHLKFGTLSIRQVWHSVRTAKLEGTAETAREKYLGELLWREFTHYNLWHRPELLHSPFRREFLGFPWTPGSGDAWQAWMTGTTGYPVVDAAARQLLAEGHVHNRARMIAASFLTKHLLVHYRAGEAHYLKYLTDGDWAQNNAGWQWSAGCGCDAQPYFRVFNPTAQGERFDPEGAYVKRYVPELAKLDAKYVHAPATAPNDLLRRAGIVLGETYPFPIVSHELARKRFLALAATTIKAS